MIGKHDNGGRPPLKAGESGKYELWKTQEGDVVMPCKGSNKNNYTCTNGEKGAPKMLLWRGAASKSQRCRCGGSPQNPKGSK